MPDPYQLIGLAVPTDMLARMDKVAPTSQRARSEFVRKAISDRLARIEREAADPSLDRGEQ